MKTLRQYAFLRFLDKDEKIFKVAHRHIFMFFKNSGSAFLIGLIVPFVLYYLFPAFLPIFLIWMGVGLVAIFYHFVGWYYDVWLLTDIGVIDIERNGFFDITSTRIEYHMMEGISYTIKGFWRTILNFGDITIDKMGARTCVILKDAPFPKRLERRIMSLQEKFIVSRSVRDHNTLKDMLSEMIACHLQNENVNEKKNQK